MAERVLRILTEVEAVDRPFDYTCSLDEVKNGDRVRVNFNNRSVRGWVLGEGEERTELKPVKKWLGFGPPVEMFPLLEWAATRWVSTRARFFQSASPAVLIRELPARPTSPALAADVLSATSPIEPQVFILAPVVDPLPYILSAYERSRAGAGSFLVLVPTEQWAQRLRGRLSQRGLPVASFPSEWASARAGWPVVVGTRITALAPCPRISGVFVVDGDDQALESEAAPTWNAVSVLTERCRRDSAPLWVSTIAPPPWLAAPVKWNEYGGGETGWPRISVVDRRDADPRGGVLDGAIVDQIHEILRSDDQSTVAIVLQRLGAGRLFVCRNCGEIARCQECQSALAQDAEGFACPNRHEQGAMFCLGCGATGFRAIRSGITTLARDVSMQLQRPVSEVNAKSEASTLERVVVGTEALWSKLRRAALVVFVDFDQYLLSPRSTATHEALRALGKAGRLVGSAAEGRGAIVVQTRRPSDPVLQSAQVGSVSALLQRAVEVAELLGNVPFCGEATIRGSGRAAFVDQLPTDVARHVLDDEIVVSAPSIEYLTAALRAVSRGSLEVRIAVR